MRFRGRIIGCHWRREMFWLFRAGAGRRLVACWGLLWGWGSRSPFDDSLLPDEDVIAHLEEERHDDGEEDGGDDE